MAVMSHLRAVGSGPEYVGSEGLEGLVELTREDAVAIVQREWVRVIKSDDLA